MATTFIHTLSGRTFTADAAGRFGATSVDGRWDTGQAGTIFPGECLNDGTQLWTVA